MAWALCWPEPAETPGSRRPFPHSEGDRSGLGGAQHMPGKLDVARRAAGFDARPAPPRADGRPHGRAPLMLPVRGRGSQSRPGDRPSAGREPDPAPRFAAASTAHTRTLAEKSRLRPEASSLNLVFTLQVSAVGRESRGRCFIWAQRRDDAGVTGRFHLSLPLGNGRNGWARGPGCKAQGARPSVRQVGGRGSAVYTPPAPPGRPEPRGLSALRTGAGVPVA